MRIALDKNRKCYVKIEDAKDSEKYYCPFCGCEVYPKALDSAYVRKHFCHYNAECKKEGIEHLMTKYYVLDKDTISINGKLIYVDKTKTLLERGYKTNFGYYVPDITLFALNGQRIFLEIKYRNPKTNNYVLKYDELKTDVIEYDINTNEMYYIYKVDTGYCGKIVNNKIKKQMQFVEYKNNNSLDSDRMKLLDDFWIECRKYKVYANESSIIDAFTKITNYQDKIYAFYLMRDLKCTERIKEVLEKSSQEIIKNCNEQYMQDKVKLFLELNKMTQKQFAEKMECKVGRLSRWLNGYYRFGKVYLSRVKEIIEGNNDL